ncbi:MarR family winged helix-turn-helix transcriptional regulator [Ramlibacter sp. AN1133]|uniref:MarR family winged helix-turn-helix transcriptional regulator n=1 Tax=Ramlibacter sp. AN1133 TaxID=3133429 RepID=UPI0030BA46D6
MSTRSTKPVSASVAKRTTKGAKASRKASPSSEPDSKHPEKAARVLRRFRVIFNAVKNHFRSVERKAGVTGAQLWALSVINSKPGAGVNELAAAMDIHQSTASNLVRALVESKTVVTAREADDRRFVQLYLTAKGQKALAKAPGPFAGVLPDALMHLDPQTLSRLERDLEAVAQQIRPAAHGRNLPLGDS